MIQVAVTTLEDPSRGEVIGMAAAPGRYSRAARKARNLHCRLVIVEIGVEQRDIEMLSSSRAFAMKQRARNRPHGMGSRADVAECDHRHVWRLPWLAAHRGEAGERLPASIVPGQMSQWSGLTETRNRTHHYTGIECAHRLITKTKPADEPGAKFSTITSTLVTKSLMISKPSALLRSTQRLRLPRLCWTK